MSQDNAEFTFVIITDTHVDVRPQATDGKWWNRTLHTLSLEVLSAAVQEIAAADFHAEPPLALPMFLGDSPRT